MLDPFSINIILLLFEPSGNVREFHFEHIIDAFPAFSRAEVAGLRHLGSKGLMMMVGLATCKTCLM